MKAARSGSQSWGEFLLAHRQRVALLGGVICYLSIFWAHYIYWLNPTWAYYGFTYHPPAMGYTLVSWALALTPCLWMPIDLRRPSLIIYWLIYLVVYLPSLFEPYWMDLRPANEVLLVVLNIGFGFFLMGLVYRLPLHRLPEPRIPPRVFWLGFAAVTLFFNFWVIYTFRGRMELVSPEDIYGQRAAAKELLATAGAVGYPMLLLSGMINPVLMSLGCVLKRPMVYLAGAAGQVVIYSCAANKSVATSMIFVPLFFLLLKRGRRRFGLVITWMLAMSMVLIFWMNYGKGYVSGEHGIGFQITDLIVLRTVATPGQVTAQYHDFFSSHPLTYMSHVHGINAFVTYPYPDSLGLEIGAYYLGYTDLNQNAHFWATDGLAGLGIPGILPISILCALTFWLIDSFAQRRDRVFAALTMTFAALNLCNASLFTCLLSGGLGPLMVLLHMIPSGSKGLDAAET